MLASAVRGRTIRAYAVALTFLVAAVLATSAGGMAQTFGEPGGFGAPREETSFTPASSEDTSASEEGYFIHDQLIKFLALLGFSAAALGLVALRTFRLRRLLLAASVIVLGFVLGGVLCPISAVQNIVLKIGNAYLLLFLVPVALAFLFGRLFCGYVCPFGALQEILHVRRWQIRIPARWMRPLSWMKYILLVLLVGRVLMTGDLLWNGGTPFKAFFLWGGTPWTLALSGLFAVVSLAIYRPFCRMLCPLGALLALISRISLFRIRVGARCVSCGNCESACSADATQMGTANAADCLMCGDCIRACPVNDLGISARGAGTTRLG